MVRSSHRHHGLVVSRGVCHSRNYSCSGIDNWGRWWLIRCRVKNMPEKRHSDQDGMSASIAVTKETKDTVLLPSVDQLDTACSVQKPLEEPRQLGVIKVNA